MGIFSLVPSLHSQLFFACCKKSGFFTTCEKKLGVETGNEARNIIIGRLNG